MNEHLTAPALAYYKEARRNGEGTADMHEDRKYIGKALISWVKMPLCSGERMLLIALAAI